MILDTLRWIDGSICGSGAKRYDIGDRVCLKYSITSVKYPDKDVYVIDDIVNGRSSGWYKLIKPGTTRTVVGPINDNDLELAPEEIICLANRNPVK